MRTRFLFVFISIIKRVGSDQTQASRSCNGDGTAYRQQEWSTSSTICGKPASRARKGGAMSLTTCFNTQCHTCGQRLQVRVEVLGRSLAWPSCGSHFRAQRGTEHGCPSPLLSCADELLSPAELRNEFRPRHHEGPPQGWRESRTIRE